MHTERPGHTHARTTKNNGIVAAVVCVCIYGCENETGEIFRGLLRYRKMLKPTLITVSPRFFLLFLWQG